MPQSMRSVLVDASQNSWRMMKLVQIEAKVCDRAWERGAFWAREERPSRERERERATDERGKRMPAETPLHLASSHTVVESSTRNQGYLERERHGSWRRN